MTWPHVAETDDVSCSTHLINEQVLHCSSQVCLVLVNNWKMNSSDTRRPQSLEWQVGFRPSITLQALLGSLSHMHMCISCTKDSNVHTSWTFLLFVIFSCYLHKTNKCLTMKLTRLIWTAILTRAGSVSVFGVCIGIWYFFSRQFGIFWRKFAIFCSFGH